MGVEEVQASTQTPELRAEAVRGLSLGSLLAGVALIFILLLAAWLRWDRLDYLEFNDDQAWSLNRAYEFVSRGEFPLAGDITSVGIRQGPVEIWLLAIPAAISRDPRVATGFVGLLQVLAVLGTYHLAGKYFGRMAGLLAATLFAVNPWAIQYARKLWPDDMMPLFTILFFTTLFAAVVQRRRLLLALSCALLAAMFLTHPSGVLYAPLLLLVVLLFWRRLGPKPLVLGAVLGLVVSLPYLFYEFTRGFHSLRLFANVGTAGASVDLEALKHVSAMASARYYPTMMGYGFRGNWALPAMDLQNDLCLWLLYAGLAVCLWHLARWLWLRRPAGYEWEKYLLVLLWFAVPVAASARHSMTMYPNYFLVVYPVQFILIALALSTPASALRRLRAPAGRYMEWGARAVAVALSVYVAASYTSFYRTYLDLLVTNGPTGPYGVPLLFAERAVTTARALTMHHENHHVYLYSYMQRTAFDYLAGAEPVLHHVEPPDTVVVSQRSQTGCLAVLTSDDSFVDRRYNLVGEGGPRIRQLKALGFEEIPEAAVRGPDGHYYYRFFRLPPGKTMGLASTFTPPPLDARLTNRMRLLGYRHDAVAKPGGKVALDLLWEMPDAPRDHRREIEYNLFAHLVDGKGRQLGAIDREVSRAVDWRSDQLMVSSHELDVPADAGPALLWFDIGAYSRYDRAGVPWQDVGGRNAGPALRLGPLKVSPPPPSRPPAVTTDFRFGESLVLVGYDVDPARPTPGGNLAVTLRWHALTKPTADYVVSVQLLDAAGRLVAQHDSPPESGNYPTLFWEAGEQTADRHIIAIPKDAPHGAYTVVTVVYSSQDQKRLRVAGATDHALLGQLALGDGR